MSPPAPIVLPWETVTPSSLKTGSFQSQPRRMDPSEKHDEHVLPVSSLSQLSLLPPFALGRWPSPSGSTKLFFPLSPALPLPPYLPFALYISYSLPFLSQYFYAPGPPTLINPALEPAPWPWSTYSSNRLSCTFSPGRRRVQYRTLVPSPDPGRLPGTSGEGVNRMASPSPQPCF